MRRVANLNSSFICITVALGLFSMSHRAMAEDWALATLINWNDPTHWNPQSVPNGVGASASFVSTVQGGSITTTGNVLLDVPVTLGSLTVDMGFAGPSVFMQGFDLTMDNGGGADVTMYTDGSLNVYLGMDIVLMGNLVTDWRAGNGQIAGSISGDYGVIQDSGNAGYRIKLWGNNTYTGPTIARKGRISIETAAGLGDHAVGTTIEADGSLIMENLSNPTISGEALTLMDGGRLLARPCNWAEEITIVNNGRIAPWFDDYEITISGKLTGTGTFTRLSAQSNNTTRPQDESIVYLTNTNNDYTGGTIIDSGILAVSDDAQLGVAGTDITFDQFGFSEGPAAMLTTADATINRNIIMLDPGWLRANANSTGTYTGVISGSRPMQIGYLDWTGIVDLQGDNTYTGDTTVVAGALQVSNTTGSATGSGNVIVEQDALLAGDGNISGSVAVNAGGALAPGVLSNSRGSEAGALTVGSATFVADSFMNVDIGGTVAGSEYDRLHSDGTINLAGTLNVSLNYTPAGANDYDIITATTIAGTFDVENLPAGFTIEYLPGIVRLHVEEQLCPADLTGAGGVPDGQINVTDLFFLLANWNTNGAGADLAAPTDIVNVSDLFALLAAWGSCP